MYNIIILIFTVKLPSRFCLHFRDEETQIQNGLVTCFVHSNDMSSWVGIPTQFYVILKQMIYCLLSPENVLLHSKAHYLKYVPLCLPKIE